MSFKIPKKKPNATPVRDTYEYRLPGNEEPPDPHSYNSYLKKAHERKQIDDYMLETYTDSTKREGPLDIELTYEDTRKLKWSNLKGFAPTNAWPQRRLDALARRLHTLIASAKQV